VGWVFSYYNEQYPHQMNVQKDVQNDNFIRFRNFNVIVSGKRHLNWITLGGFIKPV